MAAGMSTIQNQTLESHGKEIAEISKFVLPLSHSKGYHLGGEG